MADAVAEHETPGSRPRRILIVEDDDLIRGLVVDVLEDEGYAIRTAAHGEEALAVLREWPADVVLLDLMLPGMNGWRFLDERRREGLSPSARVVVLSASREAYAGERRDHDIAAIVTKPFDLAALLDAVAR
jgi:CheY-like chemotaxis protein